jgi:SUKH-3 immunity protein
MSMAARPISFDQMHPALMEALKAAGWFPSRFVDVKDVVRDLVAEGYAPNPFAIGVLESLYGLHIEPVGTVGSNFENSDPLIIDPIGVGKRHRPEAFEVEEALHETIFPIAWWLSYSHLYVAASGKTIAFSSGLVWLLGQTPEEGLDLAIRAKGELICVGARPGQRRWPPD